MLFNKLYFKDLKVILYSNTMWRTVIKIWITGMLLTFLVSACGVRPQYKTTKGKKKNKHYNSIQYHREPFKAPNR